jgi:hypothetical protein
MTADLIALIAGIIVIIAGFAGCIVPALPGPLLSYASLLIISLAGGFSIYTPALLIIIAIAAAASQFLDNFFPVLASKRAGAGKAGIWGSVIGMIAGMIFFPPFGVIVGAFIGALMGELIFNRENEHPFKAALGVFTGTIFGIVLKFMVCGVITGFFISGLRRLF